MRRRVDSVFPSGISVSGPEMKTGMKKGCILAVRMASSRIACGIFHMISIPLTAAIQFYELLAPKVIIFVSRHVSSVSRISRQNSSQDLWPFFSSRKLAWNFSYEPKEKSVPVTGPAFSTGLM